MFVEPKKDQKLGTYRCHKCNEIIFKPELICEACKTQSRNRIQRLLKKYWWALAIAGVLIGLLYDFVH